jgi:GT2 family glycosyltransferase
MSERPLVSVITGTWQRHDLLKGAVENVEQQTYPNLEHVIVSDGPDPDLAGLADYWQHPTKRAHLTFVECGRHWSSFLAASLSTVPFQVAQWLARGDLLMWLADDERMEPDHIESLVDLLERTDSDFVYSRCRMVYHPDLGDHPDQIIGADPPYKSAITNALFRADLLDYRGFTTHVGSGTDWDQIEHWIAAGARYAMLDRVTLTHRVDKIGEGTAYRSERRPLRGHSVRA